MLYLLRSLFIVAVVNGAPIWRFSVINQLENEGGKRALEQLVTTTLIFQQASKEGIKVSNQEVASRVKEIEGNLSKQGQTLDSVLALQGMTRDKLTEQLTLQILIEKMVGKDVVVTDKDVVDYMEKNKNVLPEGVDNDTLKKQIKDQLRQQKISEKFKSWVGNLQKKAKILYILQY